MRWVRIGILAVWAASVGALIWPQPDPAARPAKNATGPVDHAHGEREDWSGIYMGGDKIGYAHSRITPHADGYRLHETSLMRVTVLDRVQTVRASMDADTAPDWSVRSFSFSLASEGGPFQVHGGVRDGELHLRIESAGARTEQRIPLHGPIFLPRAGRERLAAGALRSGASVSLSVFDPSALAPHQMTVTVLGRDRVGDGRSAIDAWKIRESFRGLESEIFLDDGGRTLREEGAMGMLMVRESAADAIAAGWRRTPFDLMAAIAIRPTGPIAAPRRSAQLRVRLRGADPLAFPLDARQQRHGDIVDVRVERLSEVEYSLPYSGAEWRADLAPTAFLQSEDGDIRAAARQALGPANGARAAAERLREYVFRTLEKRPVATIPNAVQVLKMRAGDCNEHAVLFAALARAVGLPARVVAGIVFVDGTFLYHAWNEVWLGDAWVSVDPTFDQMPADATHIKLLEGGPEAHAALLPVIGQLAIEVVTTDDTG
ncbi:MAG: transglutaminase family protein [Candidatus Binatia bacterium]